MNKHQAICSVCKEYEKVDRFFNPKNNDMLFVCIECDSVFDENRVRVDVRSFTEYLSSKGLKLKDLMYAGSLLRPYDFNNLKVEFHIGMYDECEIYIGK